MIRIAFLMIICVLLALLFNQLPDYLLDPYGDYLVLVVIAVFGVLVFIVGKSK